MMSKNAKILVLSSAVICAAAFAGATDPEDTICAIPGTYFQKTGSKTIFRDRDGNTTNWVDGSYLVLLNDKNTTDSGAKWPSATVLNYTFQVRGLRLDTQRQDTYFEHNGCFQIGAAGLEMAYPGACAAMGRGDAAGLATRVKLMANQVWKGPASGNYTAFSFTDDAHIGQYNYHNDYLSADSSVTSWTLQGRLAVWFCHTNALENVDVRVEDPARIRCRTRIRPTDDRIYYAGLHAKTLTLAGDAEIWQAGGTVRSYQSGHVSTMQPLMDSITMAPTVIREGGADMQLLGAQWDIPTLRVTGTGATSSLKGDCTFLRANSAIELQDGATLELAATNSESGVSAGLSVTGTGTLRVYPVSWQLSGTVTLGSDIVFELSGPGCFSSTISGGKSYVMDPGAGKDCILSATATGASVETIQIRSGTCVIQSMAAMPASATFEVADGADLKFLSNDGYDSSRVTLTGTGTCTFGGLFVADALVPDSEIVVNRDEVLRIFGNGLTAATRVQLAGGTMRFERNGVTVASPVLVTDSSFIEAIPAVTGTVSGVIASTNTSTSTRSVAIPIRYGSATTTSPAVRGLWILGPGTTVFSGGGAFYKEYGDRIVVTRGACVHFTGGIYRFDNKTTSLDHTPIRMQEMTANLQNPLGRDYAMLGAGQHVCVRDGGELQFDSYSTGDIEPKIAVHGPKDPGQYNTTPWHPVFEVGPGGRVTIPRNSVVSLGDTDNNVYLKVTGGTLAFDGPKSLLRFGNGAPTSSGEVHLESGTLSLSRPMLRAYGADASVTNRIVRGHFIWSGGTLKLTSHFSDAYIFDMAANCYSSQYWQMNGLLRISTQLIGENCVLDLSDLQSDSVTNVPPVLDQAEWYGHGCLTVKGGKELVMNSVPDGFSLKLEGEGTRVKVAEGAYVYDYAECLKHRDHKDHDYGKTYSVTNTALSALSVAGYTLAGTNCGFSVARTMPVSVTNTTVTAGGDWNGAVALTAAGALDAQNLTFAEGSLLSVPYAGGETVGAYAGRVTLPAAMAVRAVPAAGAAVSGTTVFTAAEGVTGSPSWNMLTGRFKIFADGSRVWIVPKGTMFTIR